LAGFGVYVAIKSCSLNAFPLLINSYLKFNFLFLFSLIKKETKKSRQNDRRALF
jgi:hypothetical protein